MCEIIDVYYFGVKECLVGNVFKCFYEVWDVFGLKKKLFILELFDWLKFFMNEDVDFEIFCESDLNKLILLFYGVFLKNE